MPRHPQVDETTKKALVAQLKTEVIEAFGLPGDGYVDANFEVDDACCARYLRARDHNLTKAKAMLSATLSWRASFGVADLYTQYPALLKEADTGKTFVSPFRDVDGRVMVVMRNKLENTRDHDGNVLHLVYQMERAVRATKKTQGHEKWLLVIDFDGYSLLNAPPTKTSKATLKVMQDHYPERLYKAVLVSAPFIFNLAFKAISPFVDPVTRDKIVFITGKTQRDRCDHVAQFASLDNVERCLGGTADYVYDVNEYLADERKLYEAYVLRGEGKKEQQQRDERKDNSTSNTPEEEEDDDKATVTAEEELR